jgi:putative Mg2+ transporter-C (MgtC) family protein
VLAGAGYLIEAAVSAVFVVLIHLALRPVARRIDRMPATGDSEVETVYESRAVCHAADEAHIRALLVQALAKDGFILRTVRSQDLSPDGDFVEAGAELHR